jgi:hypothetical protein
VAEQWNRHNPKGEECEFAGKDEVELVGAEVKRKCKGNLGGNCPIGGTKLKRNHFAGMVDDIQ